MNTTLFRLYGFTNGQVDVFTRGRDQDEAMHRACESTAFARGTTISAMDHVPLHVKPEYDKSHPFDWLRTPMKWLKEKTA